MADYKPIKKFLGGRSTDEAHRAFVARIDEQREFLQSQVTETWQASVRFMKLYLAQRSEYRREARDAWMANVFVPEPFKIAETKAAVLTEMFYSADPPIQPEAVGDEDYDSARTIEKLLDYGLRKNRFRKYSSNLARMTSIKGTQFLFLGWTDDSREIELGNPDGPEMQEFQKQLAGVFEEMQITDASGVPDWMTDPKAFAEWREEARKRGVRVPELPSAKYKVTAYKGPKWELVELTDVLLDPLVQEINDQPLVMRRMMKRASWLRARAGKNGEGLYDAALVEEAVAKAGDLKLSSHEREINAFLGIPSGKDDPGVNDKNDPLCELWECWQLGSEVEYALVVNREVVVNNNLCVPYKHGQNAIGVVRNIIVPGRAYGISDFATPESLFNEQNIMRSLRINRTILETFPIFTRLIEMGMPELQEQMVPSGVIPVSRPDALKPLIQYAATHAFQDLGLMSREIAEASGIGSNLSGAPADINRVSATDAASRMQQAQVRVKLTAVVAEEELVTPVQQMLWLFAERGGPQFSFRIAGKDPYVQVPREQMIEALEMDYRFVGATRTLKKDIQVQQIIDTLTNNRDRLLPTEQREMLRTIIETLAVKGLPRILTPDGDQLAALQVRAALLQAQIDAKGLETQLVQMSLPPPPPSVTPAVAAQLSGGAPPGGDGSPPSPEEAASPTASPAAPGGVMTQGPQPGGPIGG